MNKKVLIIGEFCEDRFVYGTCSRLNPEAPTPVFIPNKEESNMGMAGNTCQNLKHLGFDVDYPFECDQLVIKKNRYVDEVSNYILLRVDTGEEHIQEMTHERVKELEIETFDAVVVSDYNKGLVDSLFLKKLFKECDKHDVPSFIDTKKNISGEWSTYVSYIKINEVEYEANSKEVLNKFHKDQLIVTLGNKGCRYMDEIYPTENVEVRDVVGAGDTFLAGLVYGYLKNNDIKEGIKIANILASNVVTKRGVGLPDKDLIDE